jgi:hypothetical protein
MWWTTGRSYSSRIISASERWLVILAPYPRSTGGELTEAQLPRALAFRQFDSEVESRAPLAALRDAIWRAERQLFAQPGLWASRLDHDAAEEMLSHMDMALARLDLSSLEDLEIVARAALVLTDHWIRTGASRLTTKEMSAALAVGKWCEEHGRATVAWALKTLGEEYFSEIRDLVDGLSGESGRSLSREDASVLLGELAEANRALREAFGSAVDGEEQADSPRLDSKIDLYFIRNRIRLGVPRHSPEVG